MLDANEALLKNDLKFINRLTYKDIHINKREHIYFESSSIREKVSERAGRGSGRNYMNETLISDKRAPETFFLNDYVSAKVDTKSNCMSFNFFLSPSFHFFSFFFSFRFCFSSAEAFLHS